MVYNIFNWPHQAKARLAVISIANTFNFPEKLTQRIQSRMGTQRIQFKPYSG